MFLFTASLRYSHGFEMQTCLIALWETDMLFNGGLHLIFFFFPFLKIVTDNVLASEYPKVCVVKFVAVFN